MFTKADSLLGRSLLDFARVVDKQEPPPGAQPTPPAGARPQPAPAR
jgi:hypothetical protein